MNIGSLGCHCNAMHSVPLQRGGVPASKGKVRVDAVPRSLEDSAIRSDSAQSLATEYRSNIIPRLPRLGKFRISEESMTLEQHPSKPQPVLSGSQEFQEIQKCIRRASRWQDLQKLVQEASGRFNETNTATALYRLGCLNAYYLPQQQTELRQSGLIQHLVSLATAQIRSFGAVEITLLLDSMARLSFSPGESLLAFVADMVAKRASSLTAQQVSLILWGFATLRVSPGPAALAALTSEAAAKAADLTPQGVSLVLWSLSVLGKPKEEQALAVMCSQLALRLRYFKPSQIAACLTALRTLRFSPGAEVLAAVSARVGGGVSASAPAVPVSGVAPKGGFEVDSKRESGRENSLFSMPSEGLISAATCPVAVSVSSVKGLDMKGR